MLKINYIHLLHFFETHTLFANEQELSTANLFLSPVAALLLSPLTRDFLGTVNGPGEGNATGDREALLSAKPDQTDPILHAVRMQAGMFSI